MITMMKMISLTLILSSVNNSNPVKMSVNLLMLSTMLFSIMAVEKSMTWMPMIFYMLFMGGILIMFMILSSLSPNENSKKMKSKIFFLILIFLSSMIFVSETVEMSMVMLKSILNSMPTSMMLIIMVIVYFLCFISIISMKKITMRSLMCQ